MTPKGIAVRPELNTEFLLIRHAPIAQQGRLFGRSDVDAALPAAPITLPKGFEKAQRISSPARRCRQTAAWLWPDGQRIAEQPAFWEQDFGAWEGMALSDIPDLGPLGRADLAAHRPPQGESFNDLALRVAAGLRSISVAGPVVVIAHAGVIRAALGLALGDGAQGLAFAVDPLSMTRISRYGENWRIGSVNETLSGVL